MNIKDIPTLYTDTQPPAGRNYAMAYRSIGSKPSGTDRCAPANMPYDFLPAF